MKRKKRSLPYRILLAMLLILIGTTVCSYPVFAEELEQGIVIADDDGLSVDPLTGEYFLVLDDVMPGDHYEKTVEVQNLREDKAFKIYMRAEPVSKEGNIDLFQETQVRISLEGEELFYGSLDGIGTTDIQQDAIELGDTYRPGDMRKLRFEITVNGDTINNGDYGKIEFRWIFSAHVDEDFTPPQTGIIVRTVLYTVLVTLCLFLLFAYLLLRRSGKNLREILKD